MSLLELDRARVSRGDPSRRGGMPPLGQRTRQAVEAAYAGLGYQTTFIKVTGHCKYMAGTEKVLRYAAKETGELENEMGQTFRTEEAVEQAQDWRKPRHHGARTSTEIVVSFKRGTDLWAAESTVRAFAAEAFAGHQYFIGWHKNEGRHPHAHLVVCTPGDHGALKLGRRELQQMRERLAELARERGIAMHARSCHHRHPSERNLSNDSDRAARRRGGETEARRKRASRILRTLRSERGRGILETIRARREKEVLRDTAAFLKTARATGDHRFYRLAAGRLRELDPHCARRQALAQSILAAGKPVQWLRERLEYLHDLHKAAGPAMRQILAPLRRQTTKAHREEMER